MANSNRITRFSADADKTIDLEAQVASALVSIDELSIKSSDSGLSEDTCWEIFGGPCPEGLRKKIKSLQTHDLLEELPVAENKENTEKDKQDTDDVTTKDHQEISSDLDEESQEHVFQDNEKSRKTNSSRESKLSEKINTSKRQPSRNDQDKELSKNGSSDQTSRKSKTSKESKLSDKAHSSKIESQGSDQLKELQKNSSLEKGPRKSKESGQNLEGKVRSKEDEPSRETKTSAESKFSEETNTSKNEQLSSSQEKQLLKNSSLEKGQRKSEESGKNINGEVNSKDDKRSRKSRTSKESKFSDKSDTSKKEQLSNAQGKELFRNDSLEKDSTQSTEPGKNIERDINNSKDDQPSSKMKGSKESKISEKKNSSIKEQLQILQEEKLYSMNDRLEKDTLESIQSEKSTETQDFKHQKIDTSSLHSSESPEKILNSINLNELPDNKEVHSKPKSSIGTCSSLLNNGIKGSITSKNQATMSESPTKISVGSQRNDKKTDVSTSRSSIGIRTMSTTVKTKRHHSLISESQFSSSEMNLASSNKNHQYDQSDSTESHACHCIHCIEHQIQESQMNEVSKCRCLTKEHEYFPCCNQPNTLSDNNIEIKIYDDHLESNKKAYQVTTFDDSNPNTCNKKQQTSMVDMFNQSRSTCPCCCRPYNVDPIYPNAGISPVYSKLQSPILTRKKKAVQKDCKCAGDFKQQSIQLAAYSKNSDGTFESSSISLSECDVANKKGLVDSLKSALLKRSVKDTVKKFEHKYALHVYDESNHQDFYQPSYKPRNIKLNQNNHWPIVSNNGNEICKCCRQLKPSAERRPNVPPVKPCRCCNYKNHYQ